MTARTMNPGTGNFLKSEAPGSLSRESITLATGNGVLKAGTVLGQITVGGKYKPYDNDASDGTQAAKAILLAEADTTASDVAAVGIVRLAEVWKGRLIWGAGITTDAEKTAAYADLAAQFVVGRD